LPHYAIGRKLARTLASGKTREKLAKWAFALVPLAALIELGAHVVQVRSAATDADWAAARDAAKPLIRPDDLVVFAPRWTDPIGRAVFGDALTGVQREAFADETRFPRAIEVSTRGGHAPELAAWRKTDERTVGPFTIATLENPSYEKTIDDLVDHLRPDRAAVSLTRSSGADARGNQGNQDESGETPCPWSDGTGAQAGGLGFGPAIPNARFSCRAAFAGVSVVTDLEYRPRRCILAPPPGGPGALRITFKDVAFGKVLHGHHGLYVEAERSKEGTPVYLAFFAGDKRLGKVTHVDGDGWKGFELPTAELAGQTGDLVVEVTSASGNRRLYGFEAITR